MVSKGPGLKSNNKQHKEHSATLHNLRPPNQTTRLSETGLPSFPRGLEMFLPHFWQLAVLRASPGLLALVPAGCL